MGKLIYATISSLDGYVADASGSFDWAAPDEEVHAFVNDLLRPTGIQLYGRRMYDVMVAWETMDVGPDQASVVRDFAAIWRAADKVVYSKTLVAVAEAVLRAGGRRVVDLFAHLRVRIVRGEQPSWYGNLNTMEEYRRWMALNIVQG